MPSPTSDMKDSSDDAAVAWARRKETIRGALKLFRVTLDAVRRHSEYVESRLGIGGAQLWVLWELRQTPGMRAVDLARNMAIHRQTADNLLRGLLGLGLVRCPTAAETASSLYFLTEAGLRLADTAPEHGQGVLKAALEQLPDAALEQVVNAMRSINECLPFREDRAALKPLAEILRPQHPAPLPVPPARRNPLEN